MTGIDLRHQTLTLDGGDTLAYDFAVVAAGAGHSYFGHDDWARFAPGLKTMEDAEEVRRRVLLAFEYAERTEDDAARREWLTFAVIGAGPTGVELAGALSEIAHHTLRGEFRRIQPRSARRWRSMRFTRRWAGRRCFQRSCWKSDVWERIALGAQASRYRWRTQ